jgi:SAM-dependent methyltransferase
MGLEIGIKGLSGEQKNTYYSNYESWQGRETSDTLGNDYAYLEREIERGNLEIDRFDNFLLGGCATPRSAQSLRALITDMRPHSDTNLHVIDLEKTAVDPVKILSQQENTKVHVYPAQGDLLSLPFAEGSMDYIRLDYLVNFIPPESLDKLFLELSRVLSKNGRISNVVSTPYNGTEFKAVGTPMEEDESGPRYISNPVSGYSIILPTREMLERAAENADLQMTTWEEVVTETSGHASTRIHYFLKHA